MYTYTHYVYNYVYYVWLVYVNSKYAMVELQSCPGQPRGEQAEHSQDSCLHSGRCILCKDQDWSDFPATKDEALNAESIVSFAIPYITFPDSIKSIIWFGHWWSSRAHHSFVEAGLARVQWYPRTDSC